MGSKGSKAKKADLQVSSGSTSAKTQLPAKKSSKDATPPYDLQYFVFLGGKVIEEPTQSPQTSTSTTPSKDALVPPKPLSEMTPEERAAWDEEVAKHENKLKMQKLMEKNLQQKLKHGDKPIEPPVKGGLLGKAKKKVQMAQEKLSSKAEELSKPTESVEERVKKQAMAGAQGTLTGGATAALGQDIAKSQQLKDLEKKRKEFAKQEEERKRKEEEERRAKEDEKKKNKPKGLNDFLQQVGSDGAPASPTVASASEMKRESVGAKLRAFLSSTEVAAPYSPSETPKDESKAPSSEISEKEKANRLQAFLGATESPTTTTSEAGAQATVDAESRPNEVTQSALDSNDTDKDAEPAIIAGEPAATKKARPVDSHTGEQGGDESTEMPENEPMTKPDSEPDGQSTESGAGEADLADKPGEAPKAEEPT